LQQHDTHFVQANIALLDPLYQLYLVADAEKDLLKRMRNFLYCMAFFIELQRYMITVSKDSKETVCFHSLVDAILTIENHFLDKIEDDMRSALCRSSGDEFLEDIVLDGKESWTEFCKCCLSRQDNTIEVFLQGSEFMAVISSEKCEFLSNCD